MKVVKWLDENLEEAVLIVLLILMVLVMGIQIVARYCLNASLSWTEELTRYLFVWSAFISISYCVKKRISIKIEQFINILPNKGKTGLRLFRHTLVFVFCMYIIPFSFEYLKDSIEFGATSPALGIPMYLIQCAPLVGFILLAIRVAQAWVREFRHIKSGEVSR